MKAVRLLVTGRVQGVGFRPSVYRLATSLDLAGSVRNTGKGVEIDVEGTEQRIAEFLSRFRGAMPPLARMASIETAAIPPRGSGGFEILSSDRGPGGAGALIPYDVAACDDCVEEVADPGNRRHGYPFTNCTLCGPRYTIIESVPYDRDRTSMAAFEMCPACRAEYENPADRRYHAQPNACARCGPRLALVDRRGSPVAGDPLREGRRLLRQGRILAVRGIGGFHLAANAADPDAVALLRRRKARGKKPFAVLVPDLAAAARVARPSPGEIELLVSNRRPIVLIEKAIPFPLADAVAPSNPRIGVMLPYSPLHHLLLDGFEALVLTSGNLAEEPIARDNAEALERLSDIADALILHDREILMSCDDSVVFDRAGEPALVRRSRGYAPDPLPLPAAGTGILAVGGHLKNTFCLTRDGEAFLSQHVGDLENLETRDHFLCCLEHMERLLGVTPAIVACDLHPDYLSTRHALSMPGVRVELVQHHHAHLASCMADRGLEGEVIGLCLDGTGFGDDGTIWGGEVLVGSRSNFRRAASLRRFALPGGAAAVREPWRAALGLLVEHVGEAEAVSRVAGLPGVDGAMVAAVARAALSGVNTPQTSSLGRFFDAVSALLGLCAFADFDGQAAMAVEVAAADGLADPWPVPLIDGEPPVLDTAQVVSGLLSGLDRGAPRAALAAMFHASLARGFAAAAAHARGDAGPGRVVLSGGCFMNRLLDREIEKALRELGFEVYAHRNVPANDGGLSLGQAAVAAARIAGER